MHAPTTPQPHANLPQIFHHDGSHLDDYDFGFCLPRAVFLPVTVPAHWVGAISDIVPVYRDLSRYQAVVACHIGPATPSAILIVAKRGRKKNKIHTTSLYNIYSGCSRDRP